MPKKGGWTEKEDMVLVEYVRKHGEGRWNMVERTTDLVRCGKSCRLRWFNHLRPNLKKGAFSPEEERLVIELHAKVGPRWAQMAAKLPGRSDNEIKNFWNTRAKRLERARLPLYPKGVVPIYNSTTTHHNQNHTTQPPSSSQTRAQFSNLNSTFNLSPHLSMGPFSCSMPVNRTLGFANSGLRNENGTNFNLGSSSNTQPFSSNNRTPISMQNQFQSQSGNLNTNPNPPLSMPTSFESQNFANNGGPDAIESLLTSTPAFCESVDGSNLMNLSSLFDLQYCFTLPFTNSGSPDSGFQLPNSYPRNENGSNFNLGLSSNSQPFSSNTQTDPLFLQYPFQSQSSNLNTIFNPPLSMATSFEPQSFFAYNEGPPNQIGSLLRPTPASCDSINVSNSVNSSSLFDLQYCFTPQFTNSVSPDPESSFRHYNSYSGNENGSNFNLGSSSNSQPFSSNTQTPISLQYLYQPQSSTLNTDPNPLLSMPNSFESQRVFANNEGPNPIESLLGPTPASGESINGSSSMNMSSLFDLQYWFTPGPYTNDGLLEEILRDPKTLVPSGISSGKGKEICTWPDSDCGPSSFYTITGMQIRSPNEEMLPLDDDLRALLESFPMEVPSTDGY